MDTAVQDGAANPAAGARRMTHEEARSVAGRTWDDVHSVDPHESGAWHVRLHDANGPLRLLPDGDSGIPAANAWSDDPKYGPQQVIPAGLERPCGHNGCAGVIRPVPGTDFFDADGSAMVDANCDTCQIQSCAYWYWPAGDPPAEDPDYYLADEEDDQPAEQAELEHTPEPTVAHPGGVPAPTINGGTVTTATGETRNIASTRTFLNAMAAAGDDRQSQAEQAVATLRGLNLDDQTLGEAQGVIEDCGQMAAKARATLRAMDDKHRLMEEAVAATPQAADRDYYRH